MIKIVEIARIAKRIEFEDDGKTSVIVVWLPLYNELAAVLDVTEYDTTNVGNYCHVRVATEALTEVV